MKKLFFFFFLTSSFTAGAQTIYHHNTFWGRIALSDKISNKLRWDFLLSERTQNDTTNKLDIVKHQQIFSYWLSFNYQAAKDLKISITPICYFKTFALFPQPLSLGNRPVKEFRWALQAEHTLHFKPVNFLNRVSLEYRLRDLREADAYIPNYRFRYRARFERPIKKEWLGDKQLHLILYGEVFFEFGEAVKEASSAFNQNRVFAGFSYELAKNVKVNPGYMLVTTQRTSGAHDRSNVLWLVLSFDNLFSQFKQNAP